MAIYFVQHGLALAKEMNVNRPLSTQGRKDIERISAHLKKVDITVNKICHSGKERAKETAQILADHIGDGNISELSGMSPNDDVIGFAEIMEDCTMYVGHLPHMSKLVSYLVTGIENTEVVKFTNGGVVCLEKDKAGFQIEWYLKPSITLNDN